MASLIPASIRSGLGATSTKLQNYYRPMFRSGSITPLWHMMIATSFIMYTSRYMVKDRPIVLAKHQEEEKAMAEYRERHGISDGHH